MEARAERLGRGSAGACGPWASIVILALVVGLFTASGSSSSS